MSTPGLEKLKGYLKGLEMGEVTDTTTIEDLLASCWHELSGNRDGGMEGRKLRERMKAVRWNPPLLSFKIARHRGTVHGSSRAEIQAWNVDVGSGSAIFVGLSGHQQISKMSGPLKVEPLAKDIAVAIVEAKKDERLQWKNKDEVRVLVGVIIPDDGPKKTLAGRRKRFWQALNEELIGTGWKANSRAQYCVREK